MKVKKIILSLIIVMLCYIVIGPIKNILAIETIDTFITFDKTLNVDEENKIIKYLPEFTTVANLLEKVKVINENYNIVIYDNSNNEKTTGKMKTNDKLVLVDNQGNLIKEYTISIFGDVSGDSNVNVHDVNRLFRYYRNTYELSPESVEAGNVKIDGEYNIVANNALVNVDKNQKVDYGIFPKEDAKITLADVAKLYQFSQGTIESINDETLTSSNDDVVITNDNVVTGVSSGTATITITGSSAKARTSIVVKTIPNVNPIDLGSKDVVEYKSNIILRNDLKGNEQLGFQDFDIIDFGTSNETYYFIIPYEALYNEVESITDKEEDDALVAMVYKIKKDDLNNDSLDDVADASIMYVRNAGQGQWIAKEPNNDFVWTSGNGQIICSGGDCNFDETEEMYSCLYDKDNDGNFPECSWWGGNNYSTTRLAFSNNLFKDTVDIVKSYDYERDKTRPGISIWTAFDWKNNLMAVIYREVGKVFVYDAQKAIEGNLELIYEFRLPGGNSDIENSYSTQGYALSGGYLYRLRGNWKDTVGIWIEQFNVFGEYVGYRRLYTGQESNRCEAQGLKIINNHIFFGIVYRKDCNMIEGTDNCANMSNLRNTIYYLK